MNKHIQNLALKAGIMIDVPMNSANEIELFAKLLVKECAGIYEYIDSGNFIEGTNHYPTAILKRFGVIK